LNVFPKKNGITQDYSPSAIITRPTVEYNKHCTLEFGTCVHVHKEHNNSLNERQRIV